jgi:hypothetical protein
MSGGYDMEGFTLEDFEVTVQDLAGKSRKHQMALLLGCHYESDAYLSVDSSSGKGTYSVLHDGVRPQMCKCEYAKYNHGQCKSHFARVQLVLNKKNARQKRQEPVASVQARGSLGGTRPFSLI